MKEEKEIEVIDEVNNKIYTILDSEEIVFHPLNPDYPIVIKEVLKEYGMPDKKLGKQTIVFKKDGETMLLYKKNDELPNKLIQKEAIVKNANYIECNQIGISIVQNKPSVCLIQDNNVYYFKYNGKKELLELVETIYIFIRKYNLK